MNIIKWSPGYYPDIREANLAQRVYYKVVKRLIRSGRYVDLKGQDAYLHALNIELMDSFFTSTNNDPEGFLKFYKNAISLYRDKMPKVVAFLYLSPFAVVLKLQLDDGQILQILSEYIEFCLKNNISGASDMFIALFIKSKRCDKNTYIEPRLFRIFMSVDPKQYLTDFGRKNYGGVLKCLYDLLNTDYLLTGENYLFKMYDFRRSSVIFEPSLGINFAGKNEALSEHAGFLIGDILAPVISEQKRIAFSKNILREAENIFRQKAGIQRVGEGWVSETLLLRRVEAAFPDVEVKQHASPSFLGRQHYDIYIPDHKIALEYQGEQHFRPVDFFGGEDAYGKAVIRDLKKRTIKK